MQRFIRSPLAWMVVVECAVVSALILLAWHVITDAAAPAAADPISFPQAAASPAGAGLPSFAVPASNPVARGPAPGLNLGIGFWRVRLGSLNQDEAAFEALEWRVTSTVMNAARDYLESVVLPAVKRAEGGGA